VNTDVVVCGAGVGGLASACALSALGLRVLVVDKQPEVRPVAKGEVLQPGALPALSSWGVRQRLEDLGALRMSKLITNDKRGQPLMTVDYRCLPTRNHWLLSHDYPSILAAFTHCLPATVELRRGVIVRQPLIDDTGRVNGVELTENGASRQVRAQLVIAADGTSSGLRKAVGIPASREDYRHRLVSFEFPLGSESVEEFNVYTSRRGLRLLYPLPGNRARLYVQIEPEELRGIRADDMGQWCRDVLAEVPGLDPVAELVMANLATRQVLPVSHFLASRLAVPGMALVGEAAHTVHPMAAQGMNSSIADAVVLGAKLGAELAGTAAVNTAVDAALARYEAERRPTLAHIGRMSRRAAGMITRNSWAGALLSRRMVKQTGANHRLTCLMAYNLAGLGVRPFTLVDRLYQVGLLPDFRAGRSPDWPE
jgi:2-polyprenyl-6-methoxyphenol hydroxylase-like FAD-dependent oxidoreductase